MLKERCKSRTVVHDEQSIVDRATATVDWHVQLYLMNRHTWQRNMVVHDEQSIVDCDVIMKS